jgi:hypothetical protein
MCCHIPPYHDDRFSPAKPTGGNHAVERMWVSLFGGVALLSLSLASAVWLASRLG